MFVSIPTDIFSTAATGAYAFDIFSKESWNNVLFNKSSGSPAIDSTIKSLVIR